MSAIQEGVIVCFVLCLVLAAPCASAVTYDIGFKWTLWDNTITNGDWGDAVMGRTPPAVAAGNPTGDAYSIADPANAGKSTGTGTTAVWGYFYDDANARAAVKHPLSITTTSGFWGTVLTGYWQNDQGIYKNNMNNGVGVGQPIIANQNALWIWVGFRAPVSGTYRYTLKVNADGYHHIIDVNDQNILYNDQWGAPLLSGTTYINAGDYMYMHTRGGWPAIQEFTVQLVPDLPVIYNLDLSGVYGLSQMTSYDIQHTAVCIQGLVNRDAPRVFLTFNNTNSHNADSTWLNRINGNGTGGLCENWRVQTVTDIYQLINQFRNYLNGVVLYDPDPNTGVISTSLVATTAAGVEGAIAVRKDTTAGSMYNYLVNDAGGPHLPVLIDLTGKFPSGGYSGGCIWQTNTPTSGSRKCDAYIWAKQKYIDTGRCNPAVLSYTLDLWALKVGLGNHPWTQLSNVDYAISQRGFCFELDPWGDEYPNDDPTQPLGTDLNTLKSILDSCNIQNNYNKMIKFCGFPNWHLKYSNFETIGGSHAPAETEWEMVRITSAYNTYLEADAPGINFVGNCSFYAGLLPGFKDRRYVQNPAPTYNDMVSRGLIDGGGNVVAGNYIMFTNRNYDQASWTMYWLGIDTYPDPVRGQVYCDWPINPNIIDRACVAFDYMYRNKSSKDYFVADDSGAGYLNPSQLYGSRSPSGYSSAVSLWQKHCRDYYRTMDYSITAWVLNGSTSLTATGMDIYVPFSGDGIGTHLPVSFTSPMLRSNIPVDVINYPGIIDYATGVHFQWNGEAWSPTDAKTIEDSYASSGHHHVFMDAYTYYYLMRYYLGGNNNYRATWIGDTIPRIMAHSATYPVTVTVRNDGWDSWNEANQYRLAYAVVPAGQTPVAGDWNGNRATIPGGATIAPGQSMVFSFNKTAPATNGAYDFYYDMIKDGVASFSAQNNIEWKSQTPIIVATNETDVDTDGDGVPDVTENANGTLYWDPDDNIAIGDKLAPAPGTATPPASVTTSTISVPYSGAYDGGSGLNKVELWYKKESGGTWTNSGLTKTAASDTFTFTPSSGSGRYYFDLVAQDNVGNRSSAAGGSGDGVTIFKLWWSDGFESGNFTGGGWTNSGCTISSTYKYSGTYAVEFNSSDTLRKAYSTSGKTGIKVQYARYTRQMETDDHFISEWYNGSAWTTLEDLTGNSAWMVKIYSLPSGANNNANFQIRFKTVHNGSTDYAYLDDVKIIGLLLNDVSPARAKMVADGQAVDCRGIVTAPLATEVTDGYFYVESIGRESGIRVSYSNHGQTTGTGVHITGAMQTLASGERCILANSIEADAGGQIKSLGMTCASLGGADLSYNAVTGAGQIGVNGGRGINNIGLLVRVWGRIVGSGTGYFVLDDGSGATVRIDFALLSSPRTLGYVAVTGISSLSIGHTRLVVPRDDSDVTPF